MVNIGIDGRCLSGLRTGVGRYVYELCKELDMVLPEAMFFVYSNMPYEPPVLSRRWHYRVEERWPWFYNRQSNLWLKTRMHDFCLKDNLDIFWATATLLPYLPKHVKIVSTVHDLVLNIVPQTMHSLTFLLYKLFFKRDIERADALLVNSQAMQKRLSEIYGHSATAVVRPAVSPIFTVPKKEETGKILALYKINFPYLLSVASWEPRKNLELLLETFRTMKKNGFLANHKLLLVGPKGWRYKRMRCLVEADRGKNVIDLGYIPDEHLPFFYAGADLFVYPSLYEGFGMPVLEARSCGAKVVTTAIPELQEAGGGDSIYVSPTQEGICSGIVNGLSDLREKASLPPAGYSWKDSALILSKVFRAVYSQGIGAIKMAL